MKHFLPLRYSIPLVLGVLGLVLVLLAFYDGLQRTEQLIESEARAQLLTFGTRVASSLERVYADRDSQGLARILLRSASEPHLRAAAIIDANGNVLENTDVVFIGKSLTEFAAPWAVQALPESIATLRAMQAIDIDGARLTALFPFALPANRGELRSRRFAVLYLSSDLSELKRLNLARHVERAWLMFGVVALVLALVWIYFSIAVTKRLERLTAAMQSVTRGDLTDRSVPVSGRDELGRLGEGFAKMLHEIRQRRRALSASEERYRSVVQAMSEGVAVIDATGQILMTNESLARIVGLQTDEMTQRTVFDPRWQVVYEDGTPMAPKDFPPVETIRTGRSQLNTILGVRQPTGEMRWLSVNCEPVMFDSGGNVGGVVATLTDITARRLAESQAGRDRERFAAIVESAMDAVISTDGEMRITVFNHAAERIFGYREADMVGQSLNQLLPAQYRDRHHDYVRRFADKGVTKREMGVPGEIIGLRSSGEEFPIEASISRVNLGNEVVLTVILRDISERKRIEMEREQLEGQLRQSQKMQSLGTLTGGIAHDFNNILTAISGNAKLAQLEMQEANLPLPHLVRRSLTEIEKAAARATDLVRQVLTFSRRQEPQRVAVDMALVVAEALKFLRAMLPAMIEIRSRLPDDLPLVAIDSTQIHQVITNLGVNAAQAIGDHAGVIDVQLDVTELTTAQALVSVDLRAGRYVRLTFADSGVGIAPEIVERIFEPFFTTKSVGQGTGLGLSVVHGIMKSHDGAIVVAKPLHEGARFELYFPISKIQSAPVADAMRAIEHKKSGNGKTIIYIDDEEALVFLITRLLERRGYTVLGFTEPNAALAELAKNPAGIDALISDLAMPGMTGFDVVRSVREQRADLPVILVSGYVRPQDAEQAQQLGVKRLVLKPDTIDGLAQALDELLTEA